MTPKRNVTVKCNTRTFLRETVRCSGSVQSCVPPRCTRELHLTRGEQGAYFALQEFVFRCTTNVAPATHFFTLHPGVAPSPGRLPVLPP
jgi:hypothetical protein